jgi:RNA-directed DNA polymerase
MSHDQGHRYEWHTISWRKLEVRVFKLQRRIYQATTRGETQKARRLQNLLAASWSAKSLAVRRVTQENTGKKTAGVDGVQSLTPPQRLKLISAMDLHAPAKPVRRIWIPKPGKLAERPLGIPIMHDRATQALVKLALEPEWEAKFEPNSFGFRPGRSSQDAVQQIWETIKIQPRYVLDADIASCFDRINQAALLEKMHTSPHFARPIKEWLKAGVVDSGIFMPTDAGTPQGGGVTLPTKWQTWCESSRRVCHAHTYAPAMGTGFWEPRSRRAASRSSPHHSREEAVVARRARPCLPTREMRLTFEPRRVSAACMVPADEPVVPLRRRPPGAGAARRSAEGAPQTQQGGRRHGS